MDAPPEFCAECLKWATEDVSRLAGIPFLLDSYCRFLRRQGINVRRCNLATDTVHPQMTGTRHVWFSEHADPGPINPAVVVRRNQYNVDDAFIDEILFREGSRQSPQYLASPFQKIMEDGELHAKIAPQGNEQPFPVFHDLAALGCTAYFGLRLRGFAEVDQKMGIAIDNPGGLSGQQLDELRTSAQVLTLLLSTLVESDIKNTLARVYIGHDPGRRVCSGMIELGRVVDIEGAIWFSDIRGFTSLSEALSPGDLVTMLNEYYRDVVGAIYGRGGEVLKYVGDAVLAIFPTQALVTPQRACAAALGAAIDARRRRSDHGRLKASQGVEDGMALHYGIAQYGNIGSADRLDFTLIGKEVNLASRAKTMADQTGENIVCTKAFSDLAGVSMRPLGSFEAKGLAEPVELFAPRG